MRASPSSKVRGSRGGDQDGRRPHEAGDGSGAVEGSAATRVAARPTNTSGVGGRSKGKGNVVKALKELEEARVRHHPGKAQQRGLDGGQMLKGLILVSRSL